jgi:hypothetical protein
LPPEERLITVSLALEEALKREAWEEADDLFAARDLLYESVPALAVPREVDDADARILAYLRNGLEEIRRESLSLEAGRRAAHAYGNGPKNWSSYSSENGLAAA